MTDFRTTARAAATAALRGLFPETPLQRNDHLSQRYGADIWLKREDLTPCAATSCAGPSPPCARCSLNTRTVGISSAPARATMRRAWPMPAAISG
jgi:hypothetical protein